MPLQLDDRQRAMLQEMGVRVWLPGTAFARPSPVASDASPGTPVQRAAPVARVPAPRPAAVAAAAAPPGQTLPAVSAAAAPVDLPATSDWASLARSVAACQVCGLCAGRGHSTLRVPTAARRADWLILGDPPDEEEDAQGLPFAGTAGELLDNMLQALHLQRANPATAAAPPEALAPERAAYVTSVVKCRPPHGVVPQADALAQCAQWLRREIALLQPRVILCMGRFANQLVLSESPDLTSQPLDRLRTQTYRFADVPVVLTYHPKALMRTTPNKAKAWADLCLAADIAETPSP